MNNIPVGGEVQRDGRPLMHAAPVRRERTQLRTGGGRPHAWDRPFPLLPGDHEPTEGVDGEADDLVVVAVEEALRVMFFVVERPECSPRVLNVKSQ